MSITTLDILSVQEQIAHLCRQYGVSTMKVFGSSARDDAGEGSDIDLLVRFSRPVTLLQLVRLERELSELLGRKVDLVTEQALSPYIRPQVLATAQVLYEGA